MIFNKQKLEGVYVIEAQSHSDERGLFRRHFCENEFKLHGIDFSVKQGNISENIMKHTNLIFLLMDESHYIFLWDVLMLFLP